MKAEQRGRRYSDSDIRAVVNRYEAGAPVESIARDVGRSVPGIRSLLQTLRRSGVRIRRAPMHQAPEIKKNRWRTGVQRGYFASFAQIDYLMDIYMTDAWPRRNDETSKQKIIATLNRIGPRQYETWTNVKHTAKWYATGRRRKRIRERSRVTPNC